MSNPLSSIAPIELSNIQFHHEEKKRQETRPLITIDHGLSADGEYRDQQIALIYETICEDARCRTCEKLTPYNPQLSPCGRPEKKQAIKWIVMSLFCTGIMYGLAYYRGWTFKQLP